MSPDNNLNLLSRKTRIGIVAAAIVIAVMCAFAGLNSAAVGNHEAYVGVTARNMLKSGDWVIPVFNGRPRLQKTPLNYWMVAAAGKLAGGENDFILRLPSASLAVVSVIAIIFFVRDWLGLRIAVISAIIWAVSLSFIRYSHTGRPEMSLTAFVTIAMLSFYSGLTSSGRKQLCCMLVFWVSFALAMLAKGPAPLPLILSPLFFYFVVFRKWKKLPPLPTIIGIVIFLLLVLPWPAAVLLKFPQAVGVWKNEYLERAAGDYASGNKPFFYYFGIMFVLFVPWSGFIIPAAAAPFYRIWQDKQKPMYYLWFWFFISIITMTLCGGKRQHYILSAMPAMAILTGVLLDDMLFLHRAYSPVFARRFLFAYAAVFAVCAVAGGIWTLNRGGNINHDTAVKNFAIGSAALLSDKDSLTGYCKVNPSFVYYFGKDVPYESELAAIRRIYQNGGSILATGNFMRQLQRQERFNAVYRGADNGRAIFKKTVKHDRKK